MFLHCLCCRYFSLIKASFDFSSTHLCYFVYVLLNKSAESLAFVSLFVLPSICLSFNVSLINIYTHTHTHTRAHTHTHTHTHFCTCFKRKVYLFWLSALIVSVKAKLCLQKKHQTRTLGHFNPLLLPLLGRHSANAKIADRTHRLLCFYTSGTLI